MATENMNTFLFPWSKVSTSGLDGIADEFISGLKHTHIENWVTNRKNNINVGDRALIIKLGEAAKESGKGLVGIGTIYKGVYDDFHPNTGNAVKKVDIRFTFLTNNPIITLDKLQEYDPTQRWDIEAGGTIVKNPDVASELYNAITSLNESALELNTILDSEVESESKLKEKIREIKDPVGFALAKYRIGQSKFREYLFKKWKSKCVVTGIKHRELLIASHIKPWAESTSAEKLDKFNGLLLSAHLDALFDKGFISFDDDGQIIISPKVEAEKKVFGIDNDMRFSIENEHKQYLKYHRENIFRK
ncbi:HNH endonuclease [Providencia rettgeri]|uniref:HNH endonuclease n=1 Tax=Providencia TaxID=586 RepID=UPI00234956AC|nr:MULTISPECIES: HNH endonuclease [Providencia]MDH2396956.1 HNH endonuclease [Providencia rettgeri]